MTIKGSKGSASQSSRTPVESPDDLINTSTAKVLDLVSEGEIVGLVNGVESIFLAETPATFNGVVNFSGFSAQWRNGTQDQTYIPAFPESQSETAVGTVVKQAVPFVRAISNNQLSAVRVRLSLPRSVSVDPKTGDSKGTVTEYRIDLATNGGAYETVVNGKFSGKTTNGYQNSHRIDLPRSTSGWFLKITRITPDSSSQNLINEFSVASITEVIDAKMRYVNSAVVATQFDAKQFDAIPSRSFHMRGMIIRVPSNYDPATRTYGGTWDGTFKRAYSNNPAWIYYDLLLNPRYGLGKRITAAQIDKWELYRISQYCDQKVSDGFGGLEPRYTCNLYLQSRAEALRVLQDIASIFRGMAYWGASQAFLTADMPDDAYKTFTNANVVDGKFSYKGTSLKSRYNVALVTWNDMNDFGRQKVEYVEDQDLLALYGRVQKVELTATGCTSRGQAQRNGRWALLTNNLENEIVSFAGGLECAYLRPGMIIRVADKNRAGPRQGGRIAAATLTSITTDKLGEVAIGDTVALATPEGGSVTRVITGINQNVVSWTTPLDSLPPQASVWGFEASSLAMQKFRVMGVTEKAAGITYAVTASKHVEGKYNGIENGTKVAQPPISQIPSSLQPKPANVRVTSDWSIEQTMAVTTMTIAWDPAPGAVEYSVQWRKDDNTWIDAGRTSSTELDVKGIYSGRYVAQVMAINVWGQGSPWASSVVTDLQGKTGKPPTVSFLTATSLVFAIRLDWGFPAGATDTLRTEVEYGSTIENAIKLGDFAYPLNTHTLMGLAPGVRFNFRARLVDRTGNIGDWSPWVVGNSSDSASEILEYIKGQITETELGQALLSKIDKIDDLQEQIDALDGLPAYKPGEVVLQGRMVVANGRIYQAKVDVPINTPPPNTTYWSDVGLQLEASGALIQQVNTNKQDIIRIDGVVTAQASTLDVLRAVSRDTDDGTGDMQDATKGWKSAASIAVEQKVRTSENEAFAQRLTTFDAAIGDNSSKITTLEQVVATNASATAQVTQQLRTDVDGANSAIQTQSSIVQGINGKITTNWSVRMQYNAANGQYVQAGIGLGIENGAGGLQSQFLVSADRFAIVNTTAGGTVSVPFAVQAGSVYINSAFIQDGTITNAKIGNIIQSNNYVPNSTGWAINKAGTFEMNNGDGTGRVQTTGDGVKVFSGSVDVVTLGKLS